MAKGLHVLAGTMFLSPEHRSDCQNAHKLSFRRAKSIDVFKCARNSLLVKSTDYWICGHLNNIS